MQQAPTPDVTALPLLTDKKRGNLKMASQIIVVFAVIAVLFTALVIYGRFAKLKKPLMKESCHGSCADCSINCKDRK